MISGINIRSASAEDASELKVLMSTYYHGVGDVSMDDFVVAEKDGGIIAACAITHDTCTELHSIAVQPDHRGQNLGAELFNFILVRNGNIGNVYVRTTSPLYFEKLGFEKLEASAKAELWDDCATCDKLDRCRQSAMCLESDNR